MCMFIPCPVLLSKGNSKNGDSTMRCMYIRTIAYVYIKVSLYIILVCGSQNYQLTTSHYYIF